MVLESGPVESGFHPLEPPAMGPAVLLADHPPRGCLAVGAAIGVGEMLGLGHQVGHLSSPLLSLSPSYHSDERALARSSYALAKGYNGRVKGDRGCAMPSRLVLMAMFAVAIVAGGSVAASSFVGFGIGVPLVVRNQVWAIQVPTGTATPTPAPTPLAAYLPVVLRPSGLPVIPTPTEPPTPTQTRTPVVPTPTWCGPYSYCSTPTPPPPTPPPGTPYP